jgi:16S rRNA (cytosine967-C5)-methyltransferase
MELMMDAVLVDAPCSGLGVMGDKPDIKFRTKEEDLVNILPLQREILESCAKAVKVGGRLVYSTCTILPEENEMQVRAFLERHPEFEMDTDASWLPESLRGRMEDGMLQLLPARDGVEGFFIARMIRRSL